MLIEALSYATALLSVDVMLVLLIGVAVGLVIGAIPGLSPPMAIALMIPVSFNLPAEQALVMMVACYAAGIYAGSFSAILLRAPGTSASAASSIEGYELTRRGKAVEAIRISTFASVVGGLLSGFVLLLLAPPLAQVALLFGPSEYFLIAILGLTAIASVSFGALAKGLISGMLGLFLATVGIDLYSGFPRFVFGITPLSSGIDIMPAIIGLFAFAQGLQLCLGPAHDTIAGVTKLSWNLFPKRSEIHHVRWSLVRGWSCGLVLGIIPAAGASVAQWIAYAWEIRRGKPGDKFGEGEIKGLAATEGSNNGSTGTSLIPMFVLGVPGGISAAVILGALIIHGLQPGMRLFTNNPDVVYTVIWGFILANIVMGVLAALMARLLAYSTVFPKGLIAPLILIFSVLGTYTNSHNLFDVWLMIAFGVLGYFMMAYRFSTAGVLLGLILGPIAENGLRDLMVVSHGSPILFTLQRPISLALIGLIALVVFYSTRQTIRERRDRETIAKVTGEEDVAKGEA
ncbi:tripartite tricarboxylate transporter permease [Afifella pfennigii]|uniref:tripartite tricarboxylate transporter permease n=1 Tax=Afifella pfennigii TaxID=209897 RepID=UPI0006923EF7|nr:tripartite tricarboxylate transporter permease [Afifella pfennigii]